MKSNAPILMLLSALLVGSIAGNSSEVTKVPQEVQTVKAVEESNTALYAMTAAGRTVAAAHYRIDAAKSRFMANVGSGGLLWFMGHGHHFAVRDFTGEATVTPESITPASLQITIKAASLEETGKNFTEQQKQIINKSARNEVLQVGEYPEIIFKSTNVTGKAKLDGQYEARIEGELTLHGVTRRIEIPTLVSVSGNTLRANGAFSINRSDYKVRTHSIKWGMIRVRNKITFEFNILADKV